MPASVAARAQRAGPALVVHRELAAERLRELQHLGLAQVAAHLGQVRAVERARVHVDQRVAVAQHVEQAARRAALAELPRALPGKKRFRSRRSGEVARAARGTRRGSRSARRSGSRAAPPGLRLRERAAHHLDPVQLVAVDAAGQANDRVRPARRRRPAAGSSSRRRPSRRPAAAAGTSAPARSPGPAARAAPRARGRGKPGATIESRTEPPHRGYDCSRKADPPPHGWRTLIAARSSSASTAIEGGAHLVLGEDDAPRPAGSARPMPRVMISSAVCWGSRLARTSPLACARRISSAMLEQTLAETSAKRVLSCSEREIASISRCAATAYLPTTGHSALGHVAPKRRDRGRGRSSPFTPMTAAMTPVRRPVHDGDEEVLAVLEMHVERAGVARPRADGVQAGHVEAVLRPAPLARDQQGLARWLPCVSARERL